jgi:hypothetical protein
MKIYRRADGLEPVQAHYENVECRFLILSCALKNNMGL